MPEGLKIKEKSLAKIKEAKEAFEKREQALNPDKKIADKKQRSTSRKKNIGILFKNSGTKGFE